MNPETVFCANLDCVAKGQVGQGNISIHSHQEGRYKCEECERTFTASKGTLFYGLKTDPAQVILVLTLLVNGCPIQAIVAAFGYDQRTVKAWLRRAGCQCQQVHAYLVEHHRLDLGQVQADEIKAKIQGGTVWMAMAMQVSSRLWLGGVISLQRDKDLIETLVSQIHAWALCRPLLLAVDGLRSYVGAFQRQFRTKMPRAGQPGRAKLRAWDDLMIVQVVKKRSAGLLEIERRIVQGCPTLIERLITHSQGAGSINTAFIERLNATFRQRLAPLVRRSRALARQPQTLQDGMFLLGCVYNLCTYHTSLAIPFWLADDKRRLLKRTPAIAAGLTDHCWSIQELFEFRVPPPRWSPPKRRGRHSKETIQLIQRWCH